MVLCDGKLKMSHRIFQVMKTTNTFTWKKKNTATPIAIAKIYFEGVFFVWSLKKIVKKRTIKASDKPKPKVWPVPYACAQPYHQGSRSQGQLFWPC